MQLAKDQPVVAMQHSTWFDYMTGYLKWKIIGPDIHNPFNTLPPLHILRRMSQQIDFLSQYVHIRCLCDGYEVMNIQNPCSPRVVTDHPSIAKLSITEIGSYMEREGLDQHVADEMARLQEDILTLLTRNEAALTAEESRTSLLPKGLKPKDHSPKPAPKGSQYRIIRRG